MTIRKTIPCHVRPLKIESVDDDMILFNDGSKITFDHLQDCCEWNYADFKQLDDLARKYTFTRPILFEAVPHYGFRFGDARAMFGVPCYSAQNGYYSADVDIYFNGEKMLSVIAQEDFS